MNIKKAQNIANYMKNFEECYKGVELWGQRDGPVTAEKLVEFLIENPCFQEIANDIKKEMDK